MEHFINMHEVRYFCRNNSLLVGLAIASLLTLIVMEFYLVDVSGWSERQKSSRAIASTLSLGYLASLIFYTITAYIPKRRDERNTEDHVIYLIERTLSHLLIMIQDSVNGYYDQKSIRISEYTKDDFKRALSGKKFNDQLACMRINDSGNPITIGQAVANNIENFHLESEKLFRYIYFLDPKIINFVNTALRNKLCESWINALKIEGKAINLNGPILIAEEKDLSAYYECIFDIYSSYKGLEEYLIARYPDNPEVMERKSVISRIRAGE
jgi:hypothetical protein